MKYSLMSHMIDSELKYTKPSFIHQMILRDLGYKGDYSSIDEAMQFFADNGVPIKNGSLTFRDFIRFAAENGFDGVDVMSFFFEEAGDEAKEILEEYGVTLAAVNILTEFSNASTEEAFQNIYSQVTSMIDKVYAAGGRNILLMPAGYVPAPGVSREQVFRNMVRGLRACVEYGNSIGMTINTETLESVAVPLCSIGEMKRLFDAVPGLKYNHDSGNPAVCLEDPIETYNEFKDLVVNVHFKDLEIITEKNMITIMNSLGIYLRTSYIGEGFIDIRKHIELLLENNYQGYITIEGLRPADNVLDGAVKALEYVRKMEEEINADK